MSGKYVPLSRRAGYVPSTSALPPDYLPRGTPVAALAALAPYSGTLNFFRFPALRELPAPDSSSSPPAGPHQPAPHQHPHPYPHPHPHAHVLAYLVLWANAHPKAGEVWYHTDAGVLIDEFAHIQAEGPGATRTNFGRPVAVFAGAPGRPRRRHICGLVVGPRTRMLRHTADDRTINDLSVVEPGSDELKTMLERKEQARSYGKGRTAEAWAESFRQTWVKLTLARVSDDHPRSSELGNPLEMDRPDRLILSLAGVDEAEGAGSEHGRSGMTAALGSGRDVDEARGLTMLGATPRAIR
ncbi:hypothetical protein Q5752_005587 [Cryptotrichosporon argae]